MTYVPECGRVCGFVADFIVAMNGHIKTPLGVKVTPIKCLGKSDSQDVIKKVILGYDDEQPNGTKWHLHFNSHTVDFVLNPGYVQK